MSNLIRRLYKARRFFKTFGSTQKHIQQVVHAKYVIIGTYHTPTSAFEFIKKSPENNPNYILNLMGFAGGIYVVFDDVIPENKKKTFNQWSSNMALLAFHNNPLLIHQFLFNIKENSDMFIWYTRIGFWKHIPDWWNLEMTKQIIDPQPSPQEKLPTP